jgi:hypothetical protein
MNLLTFENEKYNTGKFAVVGNPVRKSLMRKVGELRNGIICSELIDIHPSI